MQLTVSHSESASFLLMMQLTDTPSLLPSASQAHLFAETASLDDAYLAHPAWKGTALDTHTPEQLLDAPHDLFELWLAERHMSNSTRGVYRWMWRKLVRWLDAKGTRLCSLTYEDLINFLDDERLLKEHRYRYRTLVRRVFDRVAEMNPYLVNPARKSSKASLDKYEKNDQMRFLTHGERAAVIARLSEKTSPAKNSKEEKGKPESLVRGTLPWIEARDRAMVAAMIGAGLKVSELKGVSVSCISSDETGMFFDITPLRGKRMGHRAYVLDFAVPLIEAWGAQMDDGRPNDRGQILLFDGESTPGVPLHSSTVFRRAREFLKSCGITGDRSCAQTLRNTYAAILIEAGAKDLDLSGNLGLVKGFTIAKLRTAHEQWHARFGGVVDAA